jgi:hypothetical protein
MNMDRRTFLALGASAFATRAFPELKVFETGIADEQVLKVNQLEINVGINKPFKAFHFSDTHLNFFDAVDFCAAGREKQKHFHRRWVRFPQAVQSFLASIDYARARQLPMLHTGDLLDVTTEGNERFLEHILTGLDLQLAIGNHEYQTRAVEHYDSEPEKVRRRLQRFFRNDLTVASRVMGGINFVSFDNARGNLREETIAGVRAEFDRPLPIVLLCHIPPFYTAKFLDNSVISKKRILRAQGADEATINAVRRPKNIWDTYDRKTREFYAWTQTRPQLKAVLCGHTHFEEADGFSETSQMYVTGGNYEGYCQEITFC